MRQKLTHGRVAWAALIVAACALAPRARSQEIGLSAAISGGQMSLKVGESRVINGVESYDISNPRVLTAKPTAEGNLILNAVAGGRTTLLIRKKDSMGVLSYQVEIEGIDMEAAFKAIKAALGSIVGLQINKEGDTIVMQGKIVSRDDGKRIDVQREKYGATLMDLTDRVYLAQDMKQFIEQLHAGGYAKVNGDLKMDDKGQKTLDLRGAVYSETQKQSVLDLAQKYFDKSRIVDDIKIDNPLIEVDVEVYSFDLRKARNVGSNNVLGQASKFSSTGWTFQTGPGSVTEYPKLAVGAFTADIRALHEVGAVTNEVRQHASVRSGETAKIQNVTDLKLKIESAFDAKLESVKVGQILEITPTVLENGRFNTKVKMTSSDLAGEAQTVKSAALSIKESTYEGTYVSATDEVVVLGGGTQVTTKETINKTPILGSIPLINHFFKAKGNEKIESTTVFFMTLRTPTVEAAEGKSFGAGAKGEKEETLKESGKEKEFIEKKVKSE